MKPSKRWYLLFSMVGIIFIADRSLLRALSDWVSANPLTNQITETSENQQLRKKTSVIKLPESQTSVDDTQLIVGGLDDYSPQEFAFAMYCANKKKLLVIGFTPQHNCRGFIVHLIDHADHEIHVQAYALMCPLIINALMRAYTRGVLITVLLDKQYKNKTQIIPLKRTELYGDDTPRIAHNKILLIKNKDGLTVTLTGSYNFSTAAQTANAENIVCFFNYDEVYDAYLNNFNARLNLRKTQRIQN